MALETYKKEQERLEKEEARKAGAPEKPEDTLTVKHIINNKEQSALFGDMIEHGGDPADKELVTRLVSGKVEATDFARLDELRGQFSEKMRKAEAIRLELTPELAKEMAKGNPDLERIVKTVGADGVVKAVHETIKKMAMEDPDRFDTISRQVESIQGYKKGEFKTVNDRVEEICKKQGINADRYLKALAISDLAEREKAMKKLVLESGLLWKRITSRGRVEKLLGMQGDIDSALSALDVHKQNLGTVLGASLMDSKDLIDAMNHEIIGEPKKKEVVGMSDSKKDLPGEKDVREAWEVLKKKECPNWSTMPEADKNAFRDRFINGAKTSTEKKFAKQKGFWSTIFSIMSGEWFDNFDKKTLN